MNKKENGRWCSVNKREKGDINKQHKTEVYDGGRKDILVRAQNQERHGEKV